MNKLKLYLRTTGDIKEQAKEYAEVFNGKVLKNSFLNRSDIRHKEINDPLKEVYSFAYLEIVNDINILIALHRDQMPTNGYSGDFVIKFSNETEFFSIYENLKNSSKFKLDYDIQEYDWGTKIVKFYDSWHYGWILEIDAD